ncbi:MAG: 2Fe-2S iron-sulfur cluster binding domain-containing protein [Gammaproteobacteria bacterium]|jgi:ferredoxin, 2Fe-2S|nr:2Fe-2S iron-sulfur cluster binding domain-containing protein [Gammaproteobacteria bacterium]MDG1230944.1 2Fe-2S iron-sulfur cluster-binding protein [Pseudomonadales bacterium]MBT5153032.1 2Fe-2S iron-sulfur cluster binding domain-containing protein [Gammaproteobacteria bacterium]MBT5684564.1 2Fe-2S iron-sulfur cluster binding domain-containing protein [Gammaproteobacteria bacterium]MBT5724609.1 2Fe-2S iron-sulfur cluster binding domain-containing protein [Gammaproteobacteria bacterium]
MTTVTFVQFSGETKTVDGDNGDSVMKIALDNLVPGIDADCGGECSCATCHVLIESEWMSRVGTADDQENAMLDLNPDREPNSRLSCQIAVTDELNGLVVNLPEFQY